MVLGELGMAVFLSRYVKMMVIYIKHHNLNLIYNYIGMGCYGTKT
jgi:hypothetical protein